MISVQKRTPSLAGMSSKPRNMTAKPGIDTADISKVYYLLVVGTDALVILEILGDDISIEKVNGYARKFLVVDDVFRSRSDSTRAFARTRDANEMGAMYYVPSSSNSELSGFVKKSLSLRGNTVYGYKAPYKMGAGSRSPEVCEATHDVLSVLFCVVSQTHTLLSDVVIIHIVCKIMVGRTGQSEGWPVSLCAGTVNSVQSATSEFRSSDGGKNFQHEGTAICWLLSLLENRNLSGLSP